MEGFSKAILEGRWEPREGLNLLVGLEPGFILPPSWDQAEVWPRTSKILVLDRWANRFREQNLEPHCSPAYPVSLGSSFESTEAGHSHAQGLLIL